MSEARRKAQASGYRHYLESGTRQNRIQPPWCERSDCEYMPLRCSASGELIENWQHLGRCGHQRSCGYQRMPERKAWQPSAFQADRLTIVQEPPRKVQTKFAEVALVARTMVVPSTMQRFLHFISEQGVNEVWKAQGCMVGADPKDEWLTYFWYATRDLRFCTAKVVQYKGEWDNKFRRFTAVKRDKQGKHYQLHKSLGLDYAPILYGLPYIQLDTEVVNIVESEKSAEIMRICHPHSVWLATGGKNNLREEVLRDVSEFCINLWPDRDGINAWSAFADRWNGAKDKDSGNAYRIRVVDWSKSCVQHNLSLTADPSDWMQAAHLWQWDEVGRLERWTK